MLQVLMDTYKFSHYGGIALLLYGNIFPVGKNRYLDLVVEGIFCSAHAEQQAHAVPATENAEKPVRIENLRKCDYAWRLNRSNTPSERKSHRKSYRKQRWKRKLEHK
jgi:hypothetical protein